MEGKKEIYKDEKKVRSQDRNEEEKITQKRA
jgi:hypothetical protein